MATTQEQLNEVQAAISAVMTGQSYSIRGRTVTRASLDSLSKREEQLLARLERENSCGRSMSTITRIDPQ